MTFTKITFQTNREFADILTAELGEMGFDTFEETDQGVDAYILTERFSESDLREMVDRYLPIAQIEYKIETIEKQNWNEEWEKNYDPIAVDTRCRVRATFHEPDDAYDHEIVITPKMSFGTGHHATTQGMLELQLDGDFEGKTVLDVGSGTGILAIMAAKLGAAYVEATDIDQWCVENGLENFALNGLNEVVYHKGAIEVLTLNKTSYDVVIANINKNVLLDEMPHYAILLEKGAKLYLSGFYEEDIPDIKKSTDSYGLLLEKSVIKDNWTALMFSKY
ncbi:50S ribosomal protein L11 methyltransferase [Reichenbachiella carrageenanivorans]|uniref:Ribosomal protein L11 methyltransferase n=1 Tax=Reichenbachiella carrageenanivorans TaxID=2979869 RepID=A0ABY6D322_9BACT|nr:50S ribosomal protein L11 methyltransferase [Reichenbachiella carrageenanivorans]UXX80560.1 50S ribosomal protein L11 methyltransferase [Reichenbachiella carrageenanivorans]